MTNALMGIQQVTQVNDKLYPAVSIGSVLYSKLKELRAMTDAALTMTKFYKTVCIAGGFMRRLK